MGDAKRPKLDKKQVCDIKICFNGTFLAEKVCSEVKTVFSRDSDRPKIFCFNGSDLYALVNNKLFVMDIERNIESMVPRNLKYKHKIKLISCGKSHSVGVSEENEVFKWGNNAYGQLGEDVAAFSSVDSPMLCRKGVDTASLHDHFDIKAVSCGDFHSLVLVELFNKEGKVFSFGCNCNGQLGRGKPNELNWLPFGEVIFPEENNPKILDFSAGNLHSAAIVNFKLFTFGWGIYGQLGHGNTSSHYTPKLVESLTGIGPTSDGGRTFKDCLKVSCGKWHTSVISGYSNVYSFGWNQFGQIKPCKSENAHVYVPELVELSIPSVKNILCSPRHTVVEVSADESSTTMWIVYGTLYLSENSSLLLDLSNEVLSNVKANGPAFFRIGETKLNALPDSKVVSSGWNIALIDPPKFNSN